MSIYDQVVNFAKEIKQKKLENKNWIYFKNNKVYLVNKLPNEYYQKTNILIVDDPVKYLREINKKEPSELELKQFTFVGEIIPLIEEPIKKEYIYGEIIPPELMREHLLSLPIKDILTMRSTSKEYINIIDKLWCDLIKRDYKNVKYDKNKCEEEYKEIYNIKKGLKISSQTVKKIIKKYDSKLKDEGINKKAFSSNIDEILNKFFEKKEDYIFSPMFTSNLRTVFNRLGEHFNVPPYYIEVNITDVFDDIASVNSENLIEIANNVLKEILPKYFFVRSIVINNELNSSIYITLDDYIKIYNIYKNNSFDKDFISHADRALDYIGETGRLISVDKMLMIIHDIANYEDKYFRKDIDYNDEKLLLEKENRYYQYFGSKYKINIPEIKYWKGSISTVLNHSTLHM